MANNITEMPCLIVFGDGATVEVHDLQGAMAAICGSSYLDAEDAIDEYLLRIAAARLHVIKAMQQGKDAVVYAEISGIIKNNYAAAPDDPDYLEEEGTEPFKIRVDSESMFLSSLVQLGTIDIYRKENQGNNTYTKTFSEEAGQEIIFKKY